VIRLSATTPAERSTHRTGKNRAPHEPGSKFSLLDVTIFCNFGKHYIGQLSKDQQITDIVLSHHYAIVDRAAAPLSLIRADSGPIWQHFPHKTLCPTRIHFPTMENGQNPFPNHRKRPTQPNEIQPVALSTLAEGSLKPAKTTAGSPHFRSRRET